MKFFRIGIDISTNSIKKSVKMLTFVVVLLALCNLSLAIDKKEAMAQCFQQYSVGEGNLILI